MIAKACPKIILISIVIQFLWIMPVQGNDLKMTQKWLRSIGKEYNLSQLKKLTILILTDKPVVNHDLKYLSSLKNLEKLSLALTKVSDNGLRYLKDLHQLKRLDLSFLNITGEGLSYLKGIEELNLHKTGINNNGLKNLKHLTKLSWLNLTMTAISDEGLRHLTPLIHLKNLILNFSQIKLTAAGISYLSSLKQLQTLSLENILTPDSNADHKKVLSQLRQALPKCNIRY